MSKCIDISSKDKQKEFLKNVLNENFVDKLFDEYDDVIQLLENRDVKSLMKIKGIGNQVALKMIDEYEESKAVSYTHLDVYKRQRFIPFIFLTLLTFPVSFKLLKGKVDSLPKNKEDKQYVN